MTHRLFVLTANWFRGPASYDNGFFHPTSAPLLVGVSDGDESVEAVERSSSRSMDNCQLVVVLCIAGAIGCDSITEPMSGWAYVLSVICVFLRPFRLCIVNYPLPLVSLYALRVCVLVLLPWFQFSVSFFFDGATTSYEHTHPDCNDSWYNTHAR